MGDSYAPLLFIPIANACLLLWPVKRTNDSTLGTLRSINKMARVISGLLAFILIPLCLLDIVTLVFCVYSCVTGIFALLLKPETLFNGQFANSEFYGVFRFIFICLFYLCVAIFPYLTAFAMGEKLNPQKSSVEEPSGAKKSGAIRLSTCLAALAVCVLVGFFPSRLTTACEAAIEDGSMIPQGLLLLRAVGDQGTMLRACYGMSVRDSMSLFDPVGSSRSAGAVARETYYRVTGKPFNSLPRPAGADSDFYYDDDYYTYIDWYHDRDFAGETVGGVVKGLSLNQSNINGWVDSDESVAHLYWEMNFHNNAGFRKELRAQILLPPHAVVTGCELWVNNVRQKAVVGTRESTRQAYTVAAARGERPLMVSTAGADRVLLQSSTGYWGKDAKLVVEIAAPLTIISKTESALPLPMFAERNFDVTAAHNILLSSNEPLADKSPLISCSGSLPRLNIRGDLSNQQLGTGAGVLMFKRKAGIGPITFPDPLAPGKTLVQIHETNRAPADLPTVIAIDGSSTMGSSIDTICDALASAKFKNATIVWAADEPVVLVSNVDTGSSSWKSAINRLRDASCLGGQNNGHAIDVALENVHGAAQSRIIWLHGPQPVQFSKHQVSNAMNHANCKLFEYQVVIGPNEVVKSLDQCNKLLRVPRLHNLREDLNDLFAQLSGNKESFENVTASLPAGRAVGLTAQHATELQQIFVSDLVVAHEDNHADRLQYGTLAEQFNLVTPLTSALVLDSKNYDEYGVVKRSEANSKTGLAKSTMNKVNPFNPLAGWIPAAPEPPMPLILLCVAFLASGFLWFHRKRKTQCS